MIDSNGKSRRWLRILRITGMVVGGVALAIAFALVFGLVVQYLWNWVIPDIFGLTAITYWQAFALVILAKIFFGSFGRHNKGHESDCGHGPWSGLRHGNLSRQERKHFNRYWQEEGRSAFQNYMNRIKTDDKTDG
jgi:hypothetical protein